MHGQRQGNDRNLSRYLAGRGVWLILLEFTWVKWSWGFNFNYQFVAGQVIWALGVSMVCLAGLIRLSRPALLLVGSSLILFHNAFDFIQLEKSHPLFAIWSVLHGGELIPLGSWSRFFPLYPLIPWIGVMALGYGFGAVFLLPDGPRQRVIARCGMAFRRAFCSYAGPICTATRNPGHARFPGIESCYPSSIATNTHHPCCTSA